MLWCEPQEPPSPVACEVEKARRGLRHGLLKNRLLSLPLHDLRRSLLNRRGECLVQARSDVRMIAQHFDDYSPEVLVRRLPRLQSLPMMDQEMLRQVLRARFDGAFPMMFREELIRCGDEFLAAVEIFWRACESGVSDAELEVIHVSMRETSKRYSRALDALPKGIWLP